MPLESGWPSEYLDPASLRAEIDAMVASLVDAVLGQVPATELAGIYLKGSAHKRWDSPLDYVPEISDVDVHILFRDEGSIAHRLGTPEAAMAMQKRIEEGYAARIERPIHTPRPQLVVLNLLLQDPDYSPSPAGMVDTLWGEPYPSATYDEHKEQAVARKRLLADAAILETLPLRVVDKPGRYLLAVIRDLTWRTGPSGPRMLLLFGMPAAQVWSLNRTGVIQTLEELGALDFARAYRDYYLSAWAYFLSGYADSAAARSAVSAGIDALQIAAAAAETLRAEQSDAGP
jgi:hypothetical protein